MCVCIPSRDQRSALARTLLQGIVAKPGPAVHENNVSSGARRQGGEVVIIYVVMFTAEDLEFMGMAVKKARQGILSGQTPFAACITDIGGTVIALAHNRVWQGTDITAHGEISAIRDACARTGSVDLTGCTIYSTTEPCPMCFSAIHWARIRRIVFGASIADAAAAGFNELPISNQTMKKEGESPVVVQGGCRAEECRTLFTEWKNSGQARVY